MNSTSLTPIPHRSLLLLIGLGFFWLLLMMGQIFYLPVDRDEGFYLLASQLTAQGKHPYLDFFYPQMPYLPPIYGLFFKLVTPSLYTARLISVSFSALLLICLVWFVYRTHRTWWLAAAALVLFACQPLILAWHVRLKTYAVSDLFMFLSFVFLAMAPERKRSWVMTGLAGAWFGMAVNCRLIFAPLFPVLLLWIGLVFTRQKKSPALPPLGLFLLCSLVTSSYPLWLLLQDTFAFWFDNVRFHYLSHPYLPWTMRMVQRFESIQSFWSHPPGAFIAILAFAGVIASAQRTIKNLNSEISAPEVLAGGIMVVLLILYLQASPTYDQYFLQLFPYAVIVFVPVLITIKRQLSRFPCPGHKPLVASIAIFFVLSGISSSLGRIILRGRVGPLMYQTRTLDAIQKYMLQHAQSGEHLITWWPGYATQCQMNIWPHLEFGGAGYRVTDKLPAKKVDRLSLQKREHTIRTIEAAENVWIIDGIDTPQGIRRFIMSRCEHLAEIGGVAIYRTLPAPSMTQLSGVTPAK